MIIKPWDSILVIIMININDLLFLLHLIYKYKNDKHEKISNSYLEIKK